MRYIVLFFTMLAMLSCGERTTNEQPAAADTATVKADTMKEKEKSIADHEMKTYYMVFLNRGPKRDQDSATAAKLQEQHLAHMTKMHDEGKLLLAGPFLDDAETRGICVYNASSLEEAKKLAEEDPAVQAGRLTVVVRPWMTAKAKLEP